jgi:predicted transcriptional regulator
VKIIKIGIASLDAYKARTLAMARGEITPANDDPRIWFPSAGSFARVRSPSLLLAKPIRNTARVLER